MPRPHPSSPSMMTNASPWFVLNMREARLGNHRRIIERDLRRSCSRCGSLGAGKNDVAVVVQAEARVVRDLPGVPIEIPKGTCVPSVEGV
jgi:hypothetical protein